MNSYEISKVRETFSRLFVIAINNKLHFKAFTSSLEKSKLIDMIEKDYYDEIIDSPLEEIFYEVTKLKINNENSYGLYNDAYWCGQSYFDLHLTLDKSFAYIFLKLPLVKLIDMYKVYHEMDFSSLSSYFIEKEKEETILRLLCKRRHCSLNDIQKKTKININTLMKYNAKDESLYKGSYQNILKLIDYFDVSPLLFKE